MFTRYNRRSYLISSVNVIVVLIMILGTYFVVWAQNTPEVSSQPFKINGKEVKEYLIEKYKLHKENVISEIQQTPNGPSGTLHLRGDIKPKDIVITEDTVQGHAKAIAKAFLEKESNLLGIANMKEIQETKINTIKGYRGDITSVHFRRYIDKLELENVDIRITIGPNETITSIGASLVPPPPELYEAVKKKTLTEDEIRKIVEYDLGSTKKDLTGMKISEIRKIAIPSPPYVIWTANAGVKSDQGMWGYQIDAFTGEIIKRGYVVIH